MVNTAFKDSLDIANRVCDHCGVPHIKTVDEDSHRNQVIAPLYDKLRQYELRRNVWRFAKRKVFLRPIDENTRKLDPQLYDSTYTYAAGSVVKWTNGDLFITFENDVVGQDPTLTDHWEAYYGSQAVTLYDSTVTYSQGELVYQAGTLSGSFVVYASLVNSNKDSPNTTTAYDATRVYGLDDLAYFSGSQWYSVIPYNLANTPAVAPSDWSEATTYAAADTATGSDGYIYTSIAGSNLDHDPVADTTHTYWTQGGPYAWSRVPTLWPSSTKWLPMFCSMKSLGLDYLGISVGSSGDTGHNIFLLPAGYLREARLDTRFAHPTDDHQEYGDYILSTESNLLLAFSADITKVTRFDAMFCEMLALTIAKEACEPLTQSTNKLAVISDKYRKAGIEAREVNAIEQGPVEPDTDPWITARENA